MLLTCNSCRNTYVIDDATIEASGGQVTCDQCDEPLVPLQGGAVKDSTTVLDGYSFDNLESEWRKQQLAGAPPPEPMMPPGPDAPAPGVASQPPPYDAGGISQGPPSDNYGQPYPPPPGVDQPNGGYPPPPSAQGYPPPDQSWNQAPPGAMPPPTQAMAPVSGPPGEQGGDGMFIAPSERTMALDVDSMVEQIESGNSSPPPEPAQKASAKSAGPSAPRALPKPPQVIIGASTAGDAGSPPNPYATASTPAAQPQRQLQIPGRPPPGQPGPGQMHEQAAAGQGGKGKGFLFAIIAIFAIVLIGGAITAIVLFSAADDGEKKKGGGDEVKLTKTFEERLAESLAAPGTIMMPPIEGPVPEDGEILVVASEGIYYDANLAVPYAGGVPTDTQMEAGPSYLSSLAPLFDEMDEELPIIMVISQGLTMKGAFPAIYTAFSSGHPVTLGGAFHTSPDSVGTLELLPYDWHTPPSGSFPKHEPTELRLVISEKGITVQGAGVNPDGVKKNELLVKKLPGAYDVRALKKALADAKGTTPNLEAVRLAPSSSLDYGVLVEVALAVRGDFNFPRFEKLYLEVPQ